MTPAEQNHLVALFQGRRYDELLNATSAILAKDPTCGFAWQITGAAQEMQGENGLHALTKAVQYLPNDAAVHGNLANTLRDHGLFDEAAQSYRRALQLKPDFAFAHNGLAFTLRSLGRWDEAIVSYHRTLAIKPDYAEAYNNLGNVLFDHRQFDEAVRNYRRALEINPNLIEASDALLVASQFSEKTTRAELFAAHRDSGERVEAVLKLEWLHHDNSRAPDKRLKIGYVSGDFRMHAVAYFFEPILSNHNRHQFEIFCYANSTRHDNFTDRLIAKSDHWRLCPSMTDDELSSQIRKDGIDILVDLSGHTSLNRLRTFARKPAPIQVTYLGYPSGTGLTAVDYRLTDNYTEPETINDPADLYYTEKLARLPHSLWCYQPQEGMPEITPLPALANGYITFGSLNNVKKIGAECIALWARLLTSIPTSRLLFATVGEGDMREQLARQFAEHGISPERLEFVSNMPTLQFLHKLQEVDISLDPFPVNGATTTCESLWLGIPVLTLVGDRFLTRAGLSVLSAANMQEFASFTSDEFIEKIIALTKDLPRLAEIRANLRDRLRASPLLDQAQFTLDLEALYQQMWQKFINTNQ
jgi:predicted O-linked N-acetylglucosamine transferase (SPINDLY family)